MRPDFGKSIPDSDWADASITPFPGQTFQAYTPDIPPSIAPWAIASAPSNKSFSINIISLISIRKLESPFVDKTRFLLL